LVKASYVALDETGYCERLPSARRKGSRCKDHRRAVYGGAALALVFDLRQVTRDVDAVVRGSQEFLRRVVGEIAEEDGWPTDWLNDGVKGFLSHHEEWRAITEFQASDEGGLRLYVPVQSIYLL
jgi:hypothetical protein